MGVEPASRSLGELSAAVERRRSPSPVARIAKDVRGGALGEGGRCHRLVKERGEGRSTERCDSIPRIVQQGYAAKEGGQRCGGVLSAAARGGPFPVGELREGRPVGAAPQMALPEAVKDQGGEA